MAVNPNPSFSDNTQAGGSGGSSSIIISENIFDTEGFSKMAVSTTASSSIALSGERKDAFDAGFKIDNDVLNGSFFLYNGNNDLPGFGGVKVEGFSFTYNSKEYFLADKSSIVIPLKSTSTGAYPFRHQNTFTTDQLFWYENGGYIKCKPDLTDGGERYILNKTCMLVMMCRWGRTEVVLLKLNGQQLWVEKVVKVEMELFFILI